MPRKFSKYERGVLLVIVALIFGVLGGIQLSHEAYARDGKEDILKDLKIFTDVELEDLKVFTDVMAIVQRDYVEKVDSKKLVEGAIRGVLGALDPHSGYLDPDFYQDLQVNTKGHFGGLGIEITLNKEGNLVVVSPMSGSPAERVGVQAGDIIVKIDDKFSKGMSLVEAVKKLRGPKGTTVRLVLARKDAKDLVNVTIVREDIKVKSIKKRLLDGGYGYVRLTQFMDRTAADLRHALDEMRAQIPTKQLKGLIIDVRNNPGGLLTQAVAVSDMFVKEGIIVYTDGRVDGQKKKFFAHERGTEPDYPLVVLINGGSASASEILAGAIQDDGRGITLGTRTFGKGSVQTVMPLRNGGALTLTTALYYTKSGRSIQATGVMPDIEFDPAPELKKDKNEENEESAPFYIRESDLDGAIKNPDGLEDDGALRRINKTPEVNKNIIRIDPEHSKMSEWLANDKQVAKAIEVLKSFDKFRGEIGKGLAEPSKEKVVNG